MVLYIVRHGQSERNRLRSGPFDCPLTELGLKQAARTADWLLGRGIATIYCSPAIRTLQTASVIGRRLGVRPKAWAELVEWGYLFDSPGLTGRQMRRDFPDIEIDDTFPDDTPWIAHRTNETWPELEERAREVLRVLRERHPPGSAPVLLVTHEHFARFLIAGAVGFKELHGLGGVIRHYNGGVSALELTENGTIVRYINEHGHLVDMLTD